MDSKNVRALLSMGPHSIEHGVAELKPREVECGLVRIGKGVSEASIRLGMNLRYLAALTGATDEKMRSRERFRIHRSREVCVRLNSSVEMPSQSSTVVPPGTRRRGASPEAPGSFCGSAGSCSWWCTACARCHRLYRPAP